MAEKLLKLATPQDPIQELIKKRDTASQEELAASQKVTELETKKAQNEAERAATQAKEKEKATTELTARQAEREAPIKEEKSNIDKQLMNAHFEPSKENLESQVALFSLINVIGFAIGSGGKQNAQQAMSAMNGMLEGHQKGREDVFKQEKVKFDENFKALQSKATFLENELRHSLEEFTRDKRAADERAAAAFAQTGADFMKTYAEKNGLVAAYERAKEVRRAADKAVVDEQRRQERIQDKIDAEARAEAQRVIDDRRRLAEREEFAKFAAGLKGAGGGIGKLDREVYNIATKNYAGIDPKDLTNLSKESVSRIVNGTRALEEIEDIAKFIKQKPQAVGAAAKFQNIINYDAIKSVVGESETTAGEKARIIDSQVDDAVRAGKLTSDEASSAKLLNKKLFSLALADVQSSGQRGSVYLDKAFQNLYDQASRPETLVGILSDRAHQSNRNLGNFGMQVENRKDAGRFDLTTKGGEQWMSENFPMLTPAKVRERVAAGTLKNGDYFRTTDGRFVQVNVPAQR